MKDQVRSSARKEYKVFSMAYLHCVKIDAPSTHGSIVLELPNVSFTRIHTFYHFGWPDDLNPTGTDGNMMQIHIVDPDYKN